MYLKREIEGKIKEYLAAGKSIWLLGARQTGKTTLVRTCIKFDLSYSFLQFSTRQRLEKNPGILREEIEAQKSTKPLVVFIDEIQLIPSVMDGIQDLIDRKIAQFILTGSSVKKLKHQQLNLLPGRIINIYLDPFSIKELESLPAPSLETRLIYGTLPEMTTLDDALKEDYLDSYVQNYIDEEIRKEALVKNVGAFSRFLELAAIESGQIVNINKLSQDIGVAQTTVAAYYQVLQDCLIASRIDPYLPKQTRRHLSKSPKFLFFDLGVRRKCSLEGPLLSKKTMGALFEQFIGIELLKMKHQSKTISQLLYWRDHSGPEIDYILKRDNQIIPIEVKWTDAPTLKDAKHIHLFQAETPTAKMGYILCQAPKKRLLSPTITALPWQCLWELV